MHATSSCGTMHSIFQVQQHGTLKLFFITTEAFLLTMAPETPEQGSGSTTGIENASGTIGLNYACNTASSLTDNLAILFSAMQTDPLTGHSYQFVSPSGGLTWDQARIEALGIGGHLATITSSAEEAFLISAFPAIGGPHIWLGGYQPEGSQEPNGNWRWITGESWGDINIRRSVQSYTNWDSGEPNNSGDENCLQYTDGVTGWNDENCGSTVDFYLVEFEPLADLVLSALPPVVSVPPIPGWYFRRTPYTSIVVNYGVMNQGSISAPAAALKFFFSCDITLGTNDQLLGSVSIPSLSPGATTNNVATLYLTTPPFCPTPAWYLIGEVQAPYNETDKLNNMSTTNIVH